jgi:hypothetical protein
MQGIIDSGELHAVRDEKGEVKGVIGLVFGSGGEVLIHRLHVVDQSYGVGVSGMLLEKAAEVASKNGKGKIRVALDSRDSKLIESFQGCGYRKLRQLRGFFGKTSDMVMLELDNTGSGPKKVQVADAVDVIVRDIDGEPLTLGGRFDELTIWAVKDSNTIEDIANLGRLTYPCPEGPNTLGMLSNIGGLFCAKDRDGKVVAALEVFYTKDGKEIVFHGAPVTREGKRDGVDVAMVAAAGKITSASRMVCKSFPMEAAPMLRDALNVMIQSGGTLTGSIEPKPSPDLSYQSQHPTVVWDLHAERKQRRQGIFRSFMGGLKVGTSLEVRKMYAEDDLTAAERVAATAGLMLPIGLSVLAAGLGVYGAATTNIDVSDPQTAVAAMSTAASLPGIYCWGKGLLKSSARLIGIGLGQYCA